MNRDDVVVTAIGRTVLVAVALLGWGVFFLIVGVLVWGALSR